MRWILCGVAWLLANAAGLYVASQTKWGPTVVVLSDRHGVHLGDVLAVLVGVAVAAVIMSVLWATAPQRPATVVVVAWVLCVATWQVTAVAALVVVASTSWGPVVLRTWQGRSIHVGDVIVVALALSFATAVTLVVRATVASLPQPTEASGARLSSTGRAR